MSAHSGGRGRDHKFKTSFSSLEIPPTKMPHKTVFTDPVRAGHGGACSPAADRGQRTRNSHW